MGLVAKYKGWQESRKTKKIAKAEKLVKNAKAIKEDRWGAIEFLSDLGTPELSVKPLLQRFEYSLEHGINDTREKELAFKGITNCGEGAVPYLKEHLVSTSRIAWPIKVLKELSGDDVVVETLQSALNYGEVSFDQGAVEKNYDILCYLRDYKVPGSSEKLSHFLKDSDERVRFATVEVMIEQEDGVIPNLLEPFLSDHSTENRRIRQSILKAFIDNGWTLKAPDDFTPQDGESIVVANGSLKQG